MEGERMAESYRVRNAAGIALDYWRTGERSGARLAVLCAHFGECYAVPIEEVREAAEARLFEHERAALEAEGGLEVERDAARRAWCAGLRGEGGR